MPMYCEKFMGSPYVFGFNDRAVFNSIVIKNIIAIIFLIKKKRS